MSDVYQTAGQQWGVDPLLLQAMEQVESDGNTQATSPAGAQGNMQFMPTTAAAEGVIDPRNPAFSVPGAAKMLHGFLTDGPTKGNVDMALRYYQGGPNQAKWGPANAAYPTKVAAAYAKLKAAAGNAPAVYAQANPATMAPEDLDKALSAGSAPAPTPKTPATMSDVDLDKALTPQEAPVAAPAAAAPQYGPAAAVAAGKPVVGMSPAETEAFQAGRDQAMRGIGLTADNVMGWAERHIPGVQRVDQVLGYNPTQGANSLRAESDLYKARYVGNGPAELGNGFQQLGATGAIMGAVNPLLARGASAVADAAGGVLPRIGNALRAGLNFIEGGAAGSAPARVASGATAGALQGAEAAGLNSGGSDEPVPNQLAKGAIAGGAIGAAVPAAGAAWNAVTGGSASIPSETAQLAQMARDQYDIELKAPQIGLNPTLRYANSALKMIPGSGAGSEETAARGQWIKAVARTVDPQADVTRITPDFLSAQRKRIGGVLNTIESGAGVHLDGKFLNDAAAIEANARSSLPDSEFGVVRRQLDNILKNVDAAGDITGETYGNLIHKGSPLDAALSSKDANIRNYASQIRDALRDSLQRSVSPEDAEAYKMARTQYKNLKTIEPLTTRSDTTGGATPSTGDISPAALRAAVNKSYGASIAHAAPGDVPLNDLARIGQLMKEPPTSGTAERSSLLHAIARGGELGGAALAGHYAGIPEAAAGLAAGMAGGRLASSYLRSNFLANRLINSGMNPLAYQAPDPLLQQALPVIAGAAGPHLLYAPPQAGPRQ